MHSQFQVPSQFQASPPASNISLVADQHVFNYAYFGKTLLTNSFSVFPFKINSFLFIFLSRLLLF